MAQGFTQVKGSNFDETYALVTHLEAILLLLACSNRHNYLLYQMDVKSAFLKGLIHEDVCVAHPSSYKDPS